MQLYELTVILFDGNAKFALKQVLFKEAKYEARILNRVIRVPLISTAEKTAREVSQYYVSTVPLFVLTNIQPQRKPKQCRFIFFQIKTCNNFDNLNI